MIATHKGEIPVVVLLLPFLSGIGLAINLLYDVNIILLTVAFVALSVIFIVLNLNYNRLKLYKSRWLGGSMITVILFLFGWLLAIKHSELGNKNHFSKILAQYLVVKINNEPTLKNGILRFTTDVEASLNKGHKTPTSGTIIVTIKDTAAKKINYGDELLIPANYTPVEPPLVPAEFNYKKYLANKNIFYQTFLFPKQYVLLAKNKGNPIIARSINLRHNLVEKLKHNMRDTDAIAVASTLILGYKADLSDNILQAYTKTGTVYVLSVSGSQVAIIYALLTIALKFLERHRYGKLIRAILIISIIGYYAMLTGFSLAVCRAAVMVSMVIIGKSFNRHLNTLNILAFSAFVLLLYDPYFLTEVGFQLSYIVISGLILFQPVVYKWFKFKNKWADKIWQLCSVSIAAQVIVFPISAFYFHQFPVYSLISNIFIVIPSALIMYSGIIYLLLPQIPVVSKSTAFVLEKTIVIMNKGLAIIEHSPYASINKIWITIPEYMLLYIILISLFYFLYHKKLWLIKLSLVAMLLLSLSLSTKKITLSRSDTIAWLNLKKHQGIVFKHGNQAVILTDLKPADKIFQYSIQPYLDSCEITNLSLIQMDMDLRSAWFTKKNNLIQFMNERIFIADRPLNKGILPQKLKLDYIYLTKNQHDELNNLNNNFNFNTLVLVAANMNHLMGEFNNQGGIAHLNYKILKCNISPISLSN